MCFRPQNEKDSFTKKESSTFVEAQIKMHQLLKYYLENSPHKVFIKDEIASSDIRIGHIDSKPVKRLVIQLRSNGCGWKKSGGCTMCGFWSETSQMKEKISAEDFVNQFKRVLKKFDITQFPILSIYNAGSLLNEEEVPLSALEKMFNIISQLPTIKRVVIESRTEYVDFKKVQRLKSILKEKELVIASGLESSNDTIRQLCIHKGIQKKHFENYIEQANSLGIKTRIYILIKPPFLTEGEAIEDAVSSTKYLYDLDVKDIHYETMTIEEHTLVHTLYEKGYYQLPWLWSIIEISKRVSPFIKPYVSPFRYIADSIEVPHNCRLCTETVTKAIFNGYCSSFDLSHLRNLDCACKTRWLEAIKEKNNKPIEKRVLHILSGLTPEV